MTIRRITISVPERVASRIKKAARKKPVSAWVTDLIEEHLDDEDLERRWQEFYRDVAPRREDIRRADAIFKRLTRGSGGGHEWGRRIHEAPREMYHRAIATFERDGTSRAALRGCGDPTRDLRRRCR